MKKLFSILAMSAALFATACSQSEELVNVGSSGATVSITAQLPQIGSRVEFSDGLTATALSYAVYADNETAPLFDGTAAFENGSLSTTVDMELVTGRTYDILFWAQSPNATSYSVAFNGQTLTVDYTTMSANDENNDAFYYFLEDLTVEGAVNMPITLYRPFAQINLGTDDYDKAKKAGLTVGKTSMVATAVYNTLNLANGEVSGDAPISIAAGDAIDTTVEEYPVAPYQYLEMNYVLVGKDKSLTDCTFTIIDENGNEVNTFTVANVPVQRNYRTNIYGSLLTDPAKFTVTIDPIYEDDINAPVEEITNVIGADNKYYETLNAAIAAGNTEILIGKGEHALQPKLPIPAAGSTETAFTISGNGEDTVVLGSTNSNSNHPGNYADGLDVKLENLTFKTANNGYNGGFGHAKSVTFENCTIIGQYYAHSGAPHVFKNCTIDPLNGYIYTYGANCTFENCVFTSSEGKALQVYAESYDVESTVIIKDCTFTAAKTATTWDGKPVTAIDINSIRGNKFNVVITNTTSTGYATGLQSGNSLWNIKGGEENVVVTVDNKKVFPAFATSDGKTYGSLSEAIEGAVAEGGDGIVKIEEGEYTLPAAVAGKEVTLVGTGEAEKTVINPHGGFSGSTLIFKNVTLSVAANASYTGSQHIAAATYEDCIIEGQIFLYGTSTFVNCTFNNTGDNYNVWTYGSNATFTGCTFNCDGKAVYVYNEGSAIDDVITFNNCIFTDKEGLVGETKAAVETGANYATVKHTLIFNKCTVNGFSITGDKTGQYNWGGTSFGTELWGNKYLMTTEKLEVVVDGTVVY